MAEIKALTPDRDRLLETQQTVEHQLRMILEAYHPPPVRLFSSVDRQITLSFVQDYPTPAVASRVKTTRMAGLLARHHYTGRVHAQMLADRMRAHLLSASPGTVAGKSFSAQTFARLLDQLNRQLADYDDAIAGARRRRAPRAPPSSPGSRCRPVHDRSPARRDRRRPHRYPRDTLLLAEAGLAPVTRASGRSRSVRFATPPTPDYARTMWWAHKSMKESPWAAGAFRQARDQSGRVLGRGV